MISSTSSSENFKKGNYLGNRKIDIDLALNNLSTTELVTYKQADVILVSGVKLEMPFDNGAGGILELTSHADIKNYIVNHLLYAQVVDTEIVVSEAFGDTPAMIRVRDADGKASNIERIELHVYTGTVVDTKPIYFWAKTTSSLETLANRVGDIIQLGNDIDSIVTLSQRIDELIALQAEITNILTVHANLASVVTTAGSIASVNTTAASITDINTLALKIVELNAIYADLADILDASNQADIATAQAVIATTQATTATAQAVIATTQAGIATTKANEIKAVTAQAQTLTAGSLATASYNPVDGKLTFGIPQGTKGDKGDNFTVNAVGLLSQKSLYDLQTTGFSFLALDEALIYFKLSATSADWSLGSPFGKGETGDTGATGNGIASVSFLSTTDISGFAAQSGATDTYRITFTDATTSDFTIHNGLDSDVFMVDLTAHTNRTDNPHVVTKAQVGLGSVDNTSDADKPVSIAQQNALDAKLDATANAVSATKLATARKINGVAFDGTADVTLALATKPVIISKVNQTTVLVDGVSVVLRGGVAGKDYYIHKVGSTLSITDTKSADTIGGFHYSLVPHDEAPTGNKTEADMVKLRGINAYSIWTLWDMPLSGDARGKAKVGSSWYDIYLMDRDYGIRGYSAPTVHTGANIAAGVVDNARQIPKIPLAYGGNGTVTYGKFTWFQAGEIAVATKNRKISYNEFGGIAYGVVEGVDSAAYGDNGTIFHIPQLMSKYGIEQATGTEWIWGADVGGNRDEGSVTWAYRNVADARGQIYALHDNHITAVILGGARANGVNAGSRASNCNNAVWHSSWNFGSRFACDSLEHA